VRTARLTRLTVSLLPAFVLLATPAFAAEPTVSVGKPRDVSSPVSGRVISVGGDVSVRARVDGDVVAWGGDVRFSGAGEVRGDVIVFGGRVSGAEGRVRGRVLTPSSIAAIYLAEARRVPWQEPSRSLTASFLGVRLFVLALWLAASSLVLWLFGPAAARTALCLEESPGLAAAAGILTVATLFLAGVAAVSALPPPAGTPLAICVVALAAALKVFGMAGVFLLLGQKASRSTGARGRPAALALGLLLAGAISLVPVAGPILWSAVSVLAVGAAAFTRFGSPRIRVAVT
jgi:hypothetical protein